MISTSTSTLSFPIHILFQRPPTTSALSFPIHLIVSKATYLSSSVGTRPLLTGLSFLCRARQLRFPIHLLQAHISFPHTCIVSKDHHLRVTSVGTRPRLTGLFVPGTPIGDLAFARAAVQHLAPGALLKHDFVLAPLALTALAAPSPAPVVLFVAVLIAEPALELLLRPDPARRLERRAADGDGDRQSRERVGGRCDTRTA